MYKIIKTESIMISMSLESPFSLGFGTLHDLPRVLYRVIASNGRETIEGVGEAAIDFPFSKYDAYDTHRALEDLEILRLPIDDREQIISDKQTLSDLTPAGLSALNMALDDILCKIQGKTIFELYGRKKKTEQKMLVSIGFGDIPTVLKRVKEISRQNNTSKVKLGKSPEYDISMLIALEKLSVPYAIDFNAHYEATEVTYILKESYERSGLKNVVFIEQPTSVVEGVGGLIAVKNALHKMGDRLLVIADESFLCLEDALDCAKKGIGLNYKIQKVGGLAAAISIEKEIHKAGLKAPSMVGGTFPTAVARANDIAAYSCLIDATLPSDGLEPSTDWFTGDKDIVFRDGCDDRVGFGIAVDWDKVNKHIVRDPKSEYRSIRNNSTGKQIRIQLKPGETYSEKYRFLTGRSLDWNLV